MRVCVGRSRTSPSAWTQTSRSNLRSKTYVSSSLLFLAYILAHIASFGHCRRVYRLGHQFWVSPCQASRRRHLRSEGLATPSRCVARPSSLSFKLRSLHTADAERNHNIRIPGFASDMTPIALSQAGAVPATQSAQGAKKGAQGTQNSLRAHRLAQVAQAKREAKLM